MRILLLTLLAAAALAERVRYDGYQTFRIQARDNDQLSFLEWLDRLDQFDFWTHPRSLQLPTDILVPPRYQAGLKELLTSNGIEYSIMIDDVQALIDSQTRTSDPSSSADYYSDYRTYDEIQTRVQEIVSTHSIATEFDVGNSYEGRKIRGIKISTGSGKEAVWWQGGIHAREWISPATVMYITEKLLNDYQAGTKDVTEILDTLDIYIVPSLNVDGYAYTWSRDRFWRKTRSPNSGSACVGTDPNRNYDYKWGGAGASTSPCVETYRGSGPHSESEVKESTDYMLGVKEKTNFISFIDFHSYSQLWLYPWSYSKSALLPGDTKDHESAAKAATDALTAVHGTKYTYGPSARELYAASGCSVDWGYQVLGAKYSYVVELRDKGEYGFVLPADQIIPTGEETYAAVKAYLNAIK